MIIAKLSPVRWMVASFRNFRKLHWAASLMIVMGPASSLAQSNLPSPRWWWHDTAAAGWTNISLELIRTAAESDDAAAQYLFGRACFVGDGHVRDIEESVVWIKRAAEQKYAPAEFVLGRFHLNGVGLSENDSVGFDWISRAAQQGHPFAMGVLGRLYQYGEGTRRDAPKALEWLKRAAHAGLTEGSMWLGEFYAKGEGGTVRRTNHVDALRWYERAASNGMVAAMTTVSDLYRIGLGSPPNATLSLHWARAAADRNYPEGLERLVGFYTAGLAEPRGPDDTPVALLRRAAVYRAYASFGTNAQPWASRSSSALVGDCRELWTRYRFGIGTPRDYVAAAEWMWVAFQEDLRRVAAGQRSLNDREQAGNPFETILNGRATPLTSDERLWQEAVRLIHSALDDGQIDAWYQIGVSYRDGGTLTPKRPTMAWPWLSQAAEMGHLTAQPALESLKSSLTADELSGAKRLWVPSPKR